MLSPGPIVNISLRRCRSGLPCSVQESIPSRVDSSAAKSRPISQSSHIHQSDPPINLAFQERDGLCIIRPDSSQPVRITGI